jgi:hypothetical protein
VTAVKYHRDLSAWLALGVAVERLVESGTSEDEARTVLVEEIRGGSVKYRGPPRAYWLEAGAVDWERSLVRDFVFGPDRALPTSAPIQVRGADVLALCERVTAARPAATDRRGAKPSGERRDTEIRKEIDRMLANGEIDVRRGGPTKAARHLLKMFPTYTLGTMVGKVSKAIEAQKPKSR